MPRQRQRIVFCDCYDCVDRPATSSLSEDGLKAAEAVARQEPPPKGLIILASGFLLHQEGQLNLDACTLPHLNRLVHEGSLGFLASREADTGAACALRSLNMGCNKCLRTEDVGLVRLLMPCDLQINTLVNCLQQIRPFMSYRSCWSFTT